MSDKIASLIVHGTCVALIMTCFVLSHTALAMHPQEASALIALAWWLWGKLGFKPANPVLARILQSLDPVTVARLSSKPPADGAK